MKKITVIYNENGNLFCEPDNSLYFEQENEALQIDAHINTDKLIRAYVKASNGNSDVIDVSKISEDVYSVIIGAEYMSKGYLYVGFEAYDVNGYVERYEPLKVEVNSFVNIGQNKSNNVYVVTVDVADVITLNSDEAAYVNNIGNKKDMLLQFGIPQGVQGEKGDKGDQGIQGIQGEQGPKGEKGEAGYTPVKGVDYFGFDGYFEFALEGVEMDITDTTYLDNITESGFYLIKLYLSDEQSYPYVVYYILSVSDAWDYKHQKVIALDHDNTFNYRMMENGEEEWEVWETINLYSIDNKIKTLPQYAKLCEVNKIITANTLILNHNQETRLGELSTLILSMPNTINERYESYFTFLSGETPTTLTYSATPIRWSGDDVSYDGTFIPEASKMYEIAIKYLGDDAEGNPIISAKVGVV